MRSEIPITTFMSCSIKRTVTPSARTFSTSAISSTFSCGVPLVAIGKVARVVVGMLLDADELQEVHRLFGDPRLLLSLALRFEQGVPDFGVHPRVLSHPHVVEGGHVGEEPNLLKGSSDAQLGHPVGLEPGDVLALEDHRSRSRGVNAGDRV